MREKVVITNSSCEGVGGLGVRELWDRFYAGEVIENTPKRGSGDAISFYNRDATHLILRCCRDILAGESKRARKESALIVGVNQSNISSMIRFLKEVVKEKEFASPAHFPFSIMNAPVSFAAMKLGIKKMALTIDSATVSSLSAIVWAMKVINAGAAEKVLCGGVQDLNPSYLCFLKSRGLLEAGEKQAKSSLKNLVYPEGACIFMIEKEKTALEKRKHIWAEVASVRVSYISSPAFLIKGLASLVKEALKEAGLGTEEVDIVFCSGGTGTDLDKIERDVFKSVFGKRSRALPAVAIKSLLGEKGAAFGAFNILASIGSITYGAVFASLFTGTKYLNFFSHSAENNIRNALVCDFTLCGYNGVSIIRKNI